MLNTGFMYLMKRDKRFRPIVVMNCRVTKTFTQEDYDALLPAINHLLTYMIQNCCVKGKAETMTLIIDLSGMGMTEIPI